MGVIETITEFGNETTIHGLSYVVKSPSSTIRRIIWILFFVGSMIYAVVLLQAAVICNNNRLDFYKSQARHQIYFLYWAEFL